MNDVEVFAKAQPLLARRYGKGKKITVGNGFTFALRGKG